AELGVSATTVASGSKTKHSAGSASDGAVESGILVMLTGGCGYLDGWRWESAQFTKFLQDRFLTEKIRKFNGATNNYTFIDFLLDEQRYDVVASIQRILEQDTTEVEFTYLTPAVEPDGVRT
ncbi:hypothetical protein BKA69DRAFT_1041535, partial [Paraphysoderma sedebokerense]